MSKCITCSDVIGELKRLRRCHGSEVEEWLK
jgi:hypothetical protein